MTEHPTLLQLLGQWVTVTHSSDSRRVWHGQLVSLADHPALTLRMPEGGVQVLPQSFTLMALVETDHPLLGGDPTPAQWISPRIRHLTCGRAHKGGG